ncbi:hypothetical protein Lpp125_07022 [Lacticaseibacillus paracasei subsp. paracasei Lpp125]|uniref:Uncharacterized protein n=3 Tax=Lacticaseibacillus paracasei TaxID=1597 RepID=A0A806LEJ6_LACPA|nr:hypothetical protein AF91_00910 [Lacticaseibacillus paracasei N1115]EPC47004.1 hypothetical protein Lpp229_05801 [Lacticaseibacillus paracasei subsp. paracasei Lpp229]EPC49595.1 hypothetical protein Lpp7_12553 [Lacticaseibacillus paracasei subsp. paracasei Lpp7]EPC58153.1 hypothetical protein Lpp189_11827 [Lacticaseibacillus paracasei subsp. paracasei Lpp189]EPC81296.1 hypothetical protein Lpp37_13204 [Lacticaseibacillus paracasei subsp. paracasei Lpp37]EPC91093.1 hypothetical protein Lpp49
MSSAFFEKADFFKHVVVKRYQSLQNNHAKPDH